MGLVFRKSPCDRLVWVCVLSVARQVQDIVKPNAAHTFILTGRKRCLELQTRYDMGICEHPKCVYHTHITVQVAAAV